MNLYQYDFTDFGADPVGERARFVYMPLDSYWEEKNRYPFLIYDGNKIAGFALVNQTSLLANSNTHSIAEFFILRYLRHKKVGIAAAGDIISRFPGIWEISQTYQNVGAQNFWLKTITSLVDENFERIDLKEIQKIVLRFEYRV